MSEPVTWADLPHLLHDARLTHFAWRRGAADITLSFHCLRRNVDGSPIADPTVRVVASGVTALAVAYDAACRPSEFVPPRLLTTTDLRGWLCGDEPFVWVNETRHEASLLDALRVDWFAGSPAVLPGCAFHVGLSFGHGLPSLSLLLGCAKLEAFAGSDPLPLDLWASEYSAWWAGWRHHWDAKRANPDAEAEPVAEDTAIPAGIDPPLPADYPWPNEPIVEWEPTDALGEVLQALAQWFEEYARKPPGAFGGDRRFYARQIDSWWIEGRRGAATVRVVEHSPPSGEYPASNRECVQECLLRRTATGWTVQPLSWGWPPYGSAPARPAHEKPWLARWRSGTVLSERQPPPS